MGRRRARDRDWIEPDATIADLAGGLDDPQAYFARVVERLRRCNRTFGNARLRIGTATRPGCPNYLVEYDHVDPKTRVVSVRNDGAYSGSTHRELAPEQAEEEANWSTVTTPLAEVEALAAEHAGPPGRG